MTLIASIDRAIGLSTNQRIGVVCAAYFLFILVFFAINPNLLQLWPEIVAVLLAIGVAIKLTQDHEGINRLFFAILAVGIGFDLLNVFFLQMAMQFGEGFNLTIIHRVTDNTADHGVQINSLFYGAYLFIWICAWTTLIVHHAQQLREGKIYLLLAPVLIAGSIFVLNYQLENFTINFDFKLDHPKERLDFTFLILELIGVQLCLFCVLMGAERGMILIIIGFVIGAGNDVMAVFTNLAIQIEAAGSELSFSVLTDQKQNLDALWALGKTLTLLGLLSLPQHVGDSDRSQKIQSRLVNPRDNHSGMSIYLMLLWLLTAALAMYATAKLHERPHLLTTFIIVFSSFCVIAIAEATKRFDRAVGFLDAHIKRLFASKLTLNNESTKKPSIRRWLDVSGLDDVINDVDQSAIQLRENVIFLGPERLNRPSTIVDDSKRTTCFLVMPFSMDWSDRVTQSLRKVCKESSVYALRGDDIFKPTDILDDIWNGIMQSQFVIADITENNANVFYELGMAHAVGKPVIVLAQDADTVPFDLKSRRILIYDPNKLDALEEALRSAIEEVLTYYKLDADSKPAGDR